MTTFGNTFGREKFGKNDWKPAKIKHSNQLKFAKIKFCNTFAPCLKGLFFEAKRWFLAMRAALLFPFKFF